MLKLQKSQSPYSSYAQMQCVCIMYFHTICMIKTQALCTIYAWNMHLQGMMAFTFAWTFTAKIMAILFVRFVYHKYLLYWLIFHTYCLDLQIAFPTTGNETQDIYFHCVELCRLISILDLFEHILFVFKLVRPLKLLYFCLFLYVHL